MCFCCHFDFLYGKEIVLVEAFRFHRNCYIQEEALLDPLAALALEDLALEHPAGVVPFHFHSNLEVVGLACLLSEDIHLFLHMDLLVGGLVHGMVHRDLLVVAHVVHRHSFRMRRGALEEWHCRTDQRAVGVLEVLGRAVVACH